MEHDEPPKRQHKPTLKRVQTFSSGQLQPQRSSQKVTRRPSLPPPREIKEELPVAEPTLLEKAAAFRVKNQQKYQEREKNRENSHQMMIGKYDWDPFLKRYVEKFEKQKEETLKREAEEKQKNRKIRVRLEFNPSKERNPETSEEESNSDSDDEEIECSGFSHFKWGNLEDEYQPEIALTAIMGKHLTNGIGEGQIEKCYVTVHMFGEKQEAEMKSHTRYVTPLGTTKWNHKFAFNGLNRETLQSMYFVFVLRASTSRGKICLGQAIIAGRKALIGTKARRRSPTEEEMSPMEKVLASNDTTVLAKMDLHPEDNNPSMSFGTRLRNAVADDVSQIKSFRRKMSMGSASLTKRLSVSSGPLQKLRS